MDLNPSQQVLANHHAGPLLVISVAGSGKTTAVIENLKNKHIMKTDLRRVMVTAFNKDASEEIKKRMTAFYPAAIHEHNGLPVGTSHSLFYKILRDAGLRAKGIYQEWQAQKVLQEILGNRYKDGEDAAVYGSIGLLKNSVAYCEDIPGTDCYDNYRAMLPMVAENCEVDQNDFDRAFVAYEKDKAEQQCIDMTDMLFKAYVLFMTQLETLIFYQHRYDHLIVDEYQDTNEVQYRLFKMLAAQHKNFIAVGDDDQAIYGFRGSYPKYILSFQEDFPEATMITMDTNYRSQEGVIHTANTLIAHNEERYDKKLNPTKPHVAKPYFVTVKDYEHEANFIAECIQGSGHRYGAIAILTRINMQQAIIEQALSMARIPYEVGDGTSFFTRKEIQTLLNYLHIARGGMNTNLGIIQDVANKPYRKFKAEEVNNWQSSYDLTYMADYDKRARDFCGHINSLQVLANSGADMEAVFDYIISAPIYLGNWANKAAGLGGDTKPTVVYLQLINLCKGKTLDETIEMIEDIQKFYRNVSHNKEKVTLSTIHRAKGLEWEEVYIPGCVYEMYPHRKNIDIEEERRLFYVAVTRAKDHLIFSAPQDEVVSPFINQVLDTLDCDNLGELHEAQTAEAGATR